MEDIMEIATVPIAANQVEYHVGMYGGADSQTWMKTHNITLLSYLPLCGQCDGSDGFELINGTMVTAIGKTHNKSG
jgi:diketogulonate reductase-like aldo/keto reductase